ncbi:alpha-N-acetylgalactosaminide alpha-2,6-sialyltransferase 3-like [Patiria miniata]|uniref:Uncharacterized protein n=1 Tax=Patiria miniata TaxID=46514 RepID=A0A914AIE0_PATMI|nr:alpha-N-acetylgalactosaminide alpha-2,6-sialyltransferase 3-like [Patiria miniata]
MAIRWPPRNRCLFLLFALLNSLACIVFMMLFFDAGKSGGLFESSAEGLSEGSDKNSRQLTGDNRMLSPARRQPVNRQNEKDSFRRKGPDAVLKGYQNFLGNKSVKFQCNQCAIVTSSGQLLGTGAGREIDSNDCVLRMNNAPTKGHEEDVGSRTTIRVVGHINFGRIFGDDPAFVEEIFVNASTKTDSVVIHWSYLTDIDTRPPKEYALAVKLAQTHPNVSFNMFTPQKMVYAEDLFLHETGLIRSRAKTWMSTGWYTFLLAMDSCKQINVYGMIWGDYCTEHPDKEVPYHYYGPAFKAECRYYHASETRLTGGHLFIMEKAVFGRWAYAHNIRFHYPLWPARKLRPDHSGLLTPFMLRYQAAQNRLFSKLAFWKLFFHFSGLFYPLVH